MASTDWQRITENHNGTAKVLHLGGRFGHFYFVFCSGRRKGESEAPGGGGFGFLLKIPGGRGGGSSRTGGADGAGRVFAANWGISSGGG